LDYITLCRFTFLTHFGNKSNATEGGTTSAISSYHQHTQSTHVTDGVAVTSLSASLQNKTSVARDRLCQTALNRKVSHIIYAKSR